MNTRADTDPRAENSDPCPGPTAHAGPRAGNVQDEERICSPGTRLLRGAQQRLEKAPGKPSAAAALGRGERALSSPSMNP